MYCRIRLTTMRLLGIYSSTLWPPPTPPLSWFRQQDEYIVTFIAHNSYVVPNFIVLIFAVPAEVDDWTGDKKVGSPVAPSTLSQIKVPFLFRVIFYVLLGLLGSKIIEFSFVMLTIGIWDGFIRWLLSCGLFRNNPFPRRRRTRRRRRSRRRRRRRRVLWRCIWITAGGNNHFPWRSRRRRRRKRRRRD